jgi:hypothetical protein
MGRDASQHLDDLLFLGVWHSDLTWCCNIGQGVPGAPRSGCPAGSAFTVKGQALAPLVDQAETIDSTSCDNACPLGDRSLAEEERPTERKRLGKPIETGRPNVRLDAERSFCVCRTCKVARLTAFPPQPGG